jgi:putative membrane protein
MDKLVAGLTKATAGVLALYEGSQKLTAGTEQLADGTQELNSRVPTLASGVEQLDDGAAQVADGADQLATGLGDAADGSGQLADGLDQAEPGAGQIEEGAGRLKTEGSDELVKAGKDAQIGFARNVAQLESAQQTGLEGAGIPFGPAQGSDVVTSAAYAVYLDGVAADTESNTIAYVLGGVFVAGAAGAAFAARRRLTA